MIQVTNRAVPARPPMRRMGEIPVRARVVWEDGQQDWLPATAVRWTPTHVMVTWLDDVGVPRTQRYEWLRAVDVEQAATWLPRSPVAAGVPTPPRVAALAGDVREQDLSLGRAREAATVAQPGRPS